jgi:predicted acetyltransferase
MMAYLRHGVDMPNNKMEHKSENRIENLNTAKLFNPSLEYKDTYIEAMKEFLDEGKNTGISEENLTEQDVKNLENNFEELINKLSNHEKGIDLANGRVPTSTLWLIDNQEYIGRISIRHKLVENTIREIGHIGYAIRPSKRKMGYGNEMLKLGLEKAKDIGIKKALLLCYDDNAGSISVIEKNGGILSDKIEINGKLEREYWIDIK